MINPAEMQWRPWCYRFFSTGSGNINHYIADNHGKDIGFFGGMGENILYHGTPHCFYAQATGSTSNTVTIRTDGAIYGSNVAVYSYNSHGVPTWPPATSFNSFVNPWEKRNDNLDGATLWVVAGRGMGQHRTIVSHTPTTATVERPWRVQPDSSTIIVADWVNRDIILYRNELNDFPEGVVDMILPEIAMWLGGKEAGMYLGLSRDYVEDRAIQWQDNYVPFKLRYRHLVGDEGGQPIRRYFKPDLDALLVNPQMPSRGSYLPRFHKSPGKRSFVGNEA